MFGAPHAVWGESVVALVVPKADALSTADRSAGALPLYTGPAAAALADQVKAWAKREMAAYKAPQSVVFLPDIPRNVRARAISLVGYARIQPQLTLDRWVLRSGHG